MTTTATVTPDRAERAAPPLAVSHAYCQRLTQQAARNFYYGLKLLPPQPRRDMFALYAWMRLIDDIADDDGPTDQCPRDQRLQQLDAWQRDTHRAAAGEPVPGLVWPAFADMVRRCGVPLRVLDDAIDGQRQDLDPQPMRDFAQLHDYCYRVAGTVGLASIYIWGFDGGEETEQLAISRGVALQLTNVLRDLKEDAGRGRLYLPQDELESANLSLNDLATDRPDRAFADFVRSQIDRAESYYHKSRELESRITPACRPTLWAMTEIYHQLLRKIAADPVAALRRRVSLSLWSKLKIGWKATRHPIP